MYVTFRPSSQQLLAWQEDARSRALLQPGGGLQVEVVLPDGGVLPRRGRLDFVAPSLDPATGTQEFRAIFENRDRLLMPGQFVRVRLIGFARTETMAVPQRAVQTGLGRQFVYVVSKGDLGPFRVKIRSASFNNISIASWVLKGVYVPDIITILASLYFILGDIER